MKLYEGISYDNDTFSFDFEVDTNEKTIINLTEETKQITLYDNVFYYSYEFEDDIDSKIRTKFIHDIKFNSDISDVVKHRFITTAIDKLNRIEDLDTFDCIIFPESQSDIVSDMLEYLYLSCRKKMYSYKLVKKVPSEIEFDYEAFEQTKLVNGNYTEKQKEQVLSNIEKMMDYIHQQKYFSIARNTKYKYRKYLKNYYYFEDQNLTKIYENTKNKRILLIDDICTSGTTLSLMLNTLKCLDCSEIVMFSLIGNNKC